MPTIAQMSAKIHQPAKARPLNLYFPMTHPDTNIPMTEATVLGMPPLDPDTEAFCLKWNSMYLGKNKNIPIMPNKKQALEILLRMYTFEDANLLATSLYSWSHSLAFWGSSNFVCFSNLDESVSFLELKREGNRVSQGENIRSKMAITTNPIHQAPSHRGCPSVIPSGTRPGSTYKAKQADPKVYPRVGPMTRADITTLN